MVNRWLTEAYNEVHRVSPQAHRIQLSEIFRTAEQEDLQKHGLETPGLWPHPKP